MKRTLVLVLIAAACMLLADGVQPAGAGAEDDPYQIATLDNLLWLSTTPASWSSHFIQTADIDASDTANWNDGQGWSIIGGSSPFEGVYDGQGRQISNLWMHRDTSVGMFDTCFATIRNLHLVDVDIESTAYYAGALCARAYGSNIVNCSTSGAVTGDECAGGLIGNLDISSVVDSCSSSAVVNARYMSAGLVAETSNCDTAHTPLIQNCWFTGEVNSELFFSGIAPPSCFITNSFYSYSTVLFNGERAYSIGCLLSHLYNQWLDNGRTFDIDDCLTFNNDAYEINCLDDLLWLSVFGQYPARSFRLTADIDLAEHYTFHIPLFMGVLDGGNHVLTNLRFFSSNSVYAGFIGYNLFGDIRNLRIENGNVYGGSRRTGGLVAYSLNGDIVECSYTGTVIGNGETGGLVGIVSRGVVSKCFSNGQVIGGNETGGLIGRCRFLTDISDSYSVADVWGAGDCAGLIGSCEVGVNRCYSTGEVTGLGGCSGFISDTCGSCIASFWNTETSGQTNDYSGATGITTAEMQDWNTFLAAGWDFMGETANGDNDDWGVNPDVNNGYPFLAWQGFSHEPPVSIDDEPNEETIPAPTEALALSPARPNPFNPTTTIAFSIAPGERATLEIFNVRGQRVRAWSEFPAGEHSVVWNGRDASGEPVASGVYFSRLQGQRKQETRKMLLMK